MLNELQFFCLVLICVYVGFYIAFFLMGALRIIIYDLFDDWS